MIFNKKKIAVVVLLGILVSGCAKDDILKRNEEYSRYSDPLKAVIDLRKEIQVTPNDVHVKSLLTQYEIKAAEYYYHKGRSAFQRGDYAEAIHLFEQGLVAKPDHDKLVQAMAKCSARVEADKVYEEAVRNYQVGKLTDAETMLMSVIDMVPSHEAAEQLLSTIRSEQRAAEKEASFIDSEKKISLNFGNTNIKTAFRFLAESFGFNVVFDEGVKEQNITLQAKDVSFKQALNMVAATTRTFYKRIGRNTLLVAPDTKSKQEQYEELLIKTYHLRAVPAKDMADVLKGVLALKKVVVNDSMNSLMIRDTATMHNLVDKIVEIVDRRPAELLLEVEILEVNRNKAEQLGFDYGSVITAEFPKVEPGVTSFSSALSSPVITLPNVTFRYFKQDVDAKTLANPKIRVINRKIAKIHIGDRVPLRSSTIQNAAGQTQTSYEYSDIGIRLNVNPMIHFDNSVTVEVNLEVSSLGQNLGTPEEPTFSIGTRNAQTYMLLRDGETAVIGGLIRDEDRSNQVRVPGLGDIPVVGMLFRSYDDSLGRTDVLLTITPRIVRGWDLPRKSLHTLYSGTAERFSDERIFLAAARGTNGSPRSGGGSAASRQESGQAVAMQSAAGDSPGYMVDFDQSIYQSARGDDFQVAVRVNRTDGLRSLSLPVVFNTQLVDTVDIVAVADHVADIQKEYTDEGLMVRLVFDEEAAVTDDPTLFTITLRGQRAGISYLTIKQADWRSKDGQSGDIESRASRIVIE